MEYEKKTKIFEGSLRELVRSERKSYAAGQILLHQSEQLSTEMPAQPAYAGPDCREVTYER